MDFPSFKMYINTCVRYKFDWFSYCFSQIPLSHYLFIYLGFYMAFNTLQVISRWVVGRAEETSTYSSSGFCTVNCRPTVSNYQLSHLRPCREPNPVLRGGRRECYHSGTVAPFHTTSGIPCGRPQLVKHACPWITAGCPFANLRVSVEYSITLHILWKF